MSFRFFVQSLEKELWIELKRIFKSIKVLEKNKFGFLYYHFFSAIW